MYAQKPKKEKKKKNENNNTCCSKWNNLNSIKNVFRKKV